MAAHDVMPSKLRPIRDGLQLLALVAKVDVSAWKHVLSAHCGLGLANVDVPMDEGALTLQQQPVMLEEDHHEADHSWMAEMLTSFFSDDEASPSEPLISVAMSQILARGVTNRSELARREYLDIPVSVVISSMAIAPFLELMWRALKSLESTHHGWRFPAGPATETTIPSRRSC